MLLEYEHNRTVRSHGCSIQPLNKIIRMKIVPEKIHLLEVRNNKSQITASDEYINRPIAPAEINMDFGHEAAFNFEQKGARIRFFSLFTGVNEQSEEIGLNAEFNFEIHFRIDNFEEFVKEDNGTKRIESLLMVTLIGIVFSTCRGIIMEKTAASYFKKLIIPIIDPASLVKHNS